MSKWKDGIVKIVQISPRVNYSDMFGLGSDGKVYMWDQDTGAWQKFWKVKDGPQE